jgi:hypothetical protein
MHLYLSVGEDPGYLTLGAGQIAPWNAGNVKYPDLDLLLC